MTSEWSYPIASSLATSSSRILDWGCDGMACRGGGPVCEGGLISVLLPVKLHLRAVFMELICIGLMRILVCRKAQGLNFHTHKDSCQNLAQLFQNIQLKMRIPHQNLHISSPENLKSRKYVPNFSAKIEISHENTQICVANFHILTRMKFILFLKLCKMKKFGFRKKLTW